MTEDIDLIIKCFACEERDSIIGAFWKMLVLVYPASMRNVWCPQSRLFNMVSTVKHWLNSRLIRSVELVFSEFLYLNSQIYICLCRLEKENCLSYIYLKNRVIIFTFIFTLYVRADYSGLYCCTFVLYLLNFFMFIDLSDMRHVLYLTWYEQSE